MSENITIAIIGCLGAVIGSLATVAGQIARSCLDRQAAAKRDQPRKELLKRMLEHPEHSWRQLSTLAHVIGADEEATKELLLQLGARAAEDGADLWGFVSRNPLPSDQGERTRDTRLRGGLE